MIESLRRLVGTITREVRELARRKTVFVLRTAFAALLGLALLGGFRAALSGQAQAAGDLAMRTYVLFGAVTYVQAYIALVLAVILGVSSAFGERHRRTLGLLLLSRLRYWEIVAGKAIALLGLMLMILLAALPLFGIVGWAGGLDYAWLWRSGVLSLVLASFGVTLGLAFGFWFRVPLLAFTGALLSAVAWVQLAALVHVFVGPLAAAGVRDWSLGTALAAVASQGVQTTAFARPLLLTAAVSLLLVPFAALALRLAAVVSAGRGARGAFEKIDAGMEAINVGGIRFGASAKGRGPGGNPVRWMAIITSGLHVRRNLVRALLISGGIAFVLASGTASEARWAAIGWGIVWPALLFVPLHAGATAFAGERSRKSLPLLLSTPLTAGQLVAGKFVALLLRCAVLVLPPFALFFAVRSLVWRYPGGNLTAVSLVLAVQSLAAFFIALGPSLIARNALRAGVGALGLIAVANLLAPLVTVTVFMAAERGQAEAKVGLAALLAVFVVLGILYRVRFRGRPAWDLGAAFVLVVLLAGGIAGLPSGEDSFFATISAFFDKALPVESDSGGALTYGLYFAVLGAGSCWYVVRRFGRFTDRA